MYISTTLTTKQTFQATNPNQTNHSPVFQTNSNTVTQYTTFNVKPTKMLSDPVAEAYGLIHRHSRVKILQCADLVFPRTSQVTRQVLMPSPTRLQNRIVSKFNSKWLDLAFSLSFSSQWFCY